MKKRFEKLAFVASATPKAQESLTRLQSLYPHVPPEEADVIIALGGDGLMLATLHSVLDNPKPIYGMNRGSVGFLMNDYCVEDLQARLEDAHQSNIHPLTMKTWDTKGEFKQAHAINEVSMLRQTYEAARLCVQVDGKTRLEELISDGILIATPAGSTAYNLSVNGPIVPLSAPLLALTPISAFRPRRWRGALLPDSVVITITVLEPEQRPVAAVADHNEVRHAIRVEASLDRSITLTMLHDIGHGLDERILREQFG